MLEDKKKNILDLYITEFCRFYKKNKKKGLCIQTNKNLKIESHNHLGPVLSFSERRNQ